MESHYATQYYLGYSTCYSDGSIIIVISPLILLMLDQVRAFQEKNLSSLALSNVDDKLNECVCDGCYQVVFMSPEDSLGRYRKKRYAFEFDF